MEIRMLGLQELSLALDLVWEVFEQDVAPSYREEGIEKFREYICYEDMSRRFQTRELYFFGAFEGEKLLGVIAVSRTGHICLFFVRKDQQGKGIGKMLYQKVCELCTQGLAVNRVTMNATPNAVNSCMHLGMRAVDKEQEASGMRFTPMEAYVAAGGTMPSGNHSKKTATIIAVAVGIGMLLLVMAIAGVFVWGVFRNINEYHHNYYDYPYEEFMPYEEWAEEEYWSEEDTGDLGGLEQIPAYEEDVSYQVEEETYNYLDTEKTTTYIEFHVLYPQLSGEGRDYTKVNQTIKDCAMATVDEIYTHPDETVKDKVVQAENPALVSNVAYKICYQSEHFISIAFQDNYAKGDADSYGGDLRTLNIGLDDGEVYEIKDVVTLDDKFMNQWLDVMRSEAENDALLKELDLQEMKGILQGEIKEDIYKENFFVYEEGIEIGFDFNYSENDEHDLGYMWVTAPFDWDEIEPYKTDHKFWDMLQK